MAIQTRYLFTAAMDVEPSTEMADEMDFARNLEICMPYLGTLTGAYTDWTPLHDRERLFPEDLDQSDPWQFKNVLVS